LHCDVLERFILTRFTVDYRLNKDGSILVDNTTVESVDAPIPLVSIYFVPAEKVTQTLLKARNIAKLLEYVMKNAVARLECRKTDRVKKNYYVFAFFMDRVAQDAKIGLVISNQAEGFSGNERDTETFHENGWHVAYAPARFAIDASPQVFFKVLYTPGVSATSKQHRQIVAGLFASDSLTRQAQRLLATRGYNPGPLDGIMGDTTRRAIKKFQQKQGLKADGNLSAGLFALLAGPVGRSTVIKTDTGVPRTGMRDWLKPKMWSNRIERP
jgi:hypothetical protein